MNNDLVKYYSARALEYEKIYLKPERQEELNILKEYLQHEFSNLDVYEAACGTGYWTQTISRTAKSIHAADINEEVMQIAGQKHYPDDNVSFHIEDIYKPEKEPKHEALFGGFIWSHIPLNRIEEFLDSIESRVKTGGKIILIDNNFVKGSSTPVSSEDKDGNTYQLRKLSDGSEHHVLKNFPQAEYLKELFVRRNISIEFIIRRYFWILKYFRNNRSLVLEV